MEALDQGLCSLKVIERKAFTSLIGEYETVVMSFSQRMGWYRQIIEDRPVVIASLITTIQRSKLLAGKRATVSGIPLLLFGRERCETKRQLSVIKCIATVCDVA